LAMKNKYKTQAKNGKRIVYALEHDAVSAFKTEKELERLDLKEWARVISAPLIEQSVNGSQYLWYDMKELPELEIDLLFVDGPPVNIGKLARYPALGLLGEYLKAGAKIILDDGIRAEEQEILKKWLEEDSRLEKLEGHFERGAFLLKKKP